MRLWSLHPSLLDTKGLVALWRESLLAKKVLENKTKGYKNHPQLVRFRKFNNPVDAINYYLAEIYKEALSRNYNFDITKIDWAFKKQKQDVTSGQIQFELEHLLKKTKSRSPAHIIGTTKKINHPIFRIINGGIERWEIIKPG